MMGSSYRVPFGFRSMLRYRTFLPPPSPRNDMILGSDRQICDFSPFYSIVSLLNCFPNIFKFFFYPMSRSILPAVIRWILFHGLPQELFSSYRFLFRRTLSCSVTLGRYFQSAVLWICADPHILSDDLASRRLLPRYPCSFSVVPGGRSRPSGFGPVGLDHFSTNPFLCFVGQVVVPSVPTQPGPSGGKAFSNSPGGPDPRLPAGLFPFALSGARATTFHRRCSPDLVTPRID